MVVALMLMLSAVAEAAYDWSWWPYKLLSAGGSEDIELTENNGGRAMAFGTLQGVSQAAIAYSRNGKACYVQVVDGEPLNREWPNEDQPCEDAYAVSAISFGAGTPEKMVVWPSCDWTAPDLLDTFFRRHLLALRTQMG